jgi:hypothetical protein
VAIASKIFEGITVSKSGELFRGTRLVSVSSWTASYINLK